MHKYRMTCMGFDFMIISGIPDWVKDVSIIDTQKGPLFQISDGDRRTLTNWFGSWILNGHLYKELRLVGWLQDYDYLVEFMKMDPKISNMFFDPDSIPGKHFIIQEITKNTRLFENHILPDSSTRGISMW